jgi:hypothetical protein
MSGDNFAIQIERLGSSQSYRVLRFWNNDVMGNGKHLLRAIWLFMPRNARAQASAAAKRCDAGHPTPIPSR